jgi:hypothetical protein
MTIFAVHPVVKNVVTDTCKALLDVRQKPSKAWLVELFVEAVDVT